MMREAQQMKRSPRPEAPALLALPLALLLATGCAGGDGALRAAAGDDAEADAGAHVGDADSSPAADADADAVDPDGGKKNQNTPNQGDAGDASPDAGEGPGDGGEDGGEGGEPSALCEAYASAPDEPAKLQDARLTGVSGIVASRRNPGILWVHNDYAGLPTVFAVEAATGVTRGVLSAPDGDSAKNLEDIALADCPAPAGDETCLWLADSGNNNRERTDLSVIVLSEPLLATPWPEAPEAWTAARAWRFPFSYPSDSCDAEAFVVEPDGSAFYLLEKVDADAARLFEARGPFADEVPVALAEIGRLAAPRFILGGGFDLTPPLGLMMTGADLHQSRARFALRTYIGTFEYRFATDDWPRELSGVEPAVVAWGPLSELQGESVAYDASGVSLWTISEDKDQQPGQGIHFYPCLDAAPAGSAAAGE